MGSVMISNFGEHFYFNYNPIIFNGFLPIARSVYSPRVINYYRLGEFKRDFYFGIYDGFGIRNAQFRTIGLNKPLTQNPPLSN